MASLRQLLVMRLARREPLCRFLSSFTGQKHEMRIGNDEMDGEGADHMHETSKDSVYAFWLLQNSRSLNMGADKDRVVATLKKHLSRPGRLVYFGAYREIDTESNVGWTKDRHGYREFSYFEELRCPYCECYFAVDMMHLRRHFEERHRRRDKPVKPRKYQKVFRKGPEDHHFIGGGINEFGSSTSFLEPQATERELQAALNRMHHDGAMTGTGEDTFLHSLRQYDVTVVNVQRHSFIKHVLEEARRWLHRRATTASNSPRQVVAIITSSHYKALRLLKILNLEFGCNTILIYDGYNGVDRVDTAKRHHTEYNLQDLLEASTEK